MITRDEYARAIDSFLMELHGSVAALTEADIQRMPAFLAELQESIQYFRNPSTTLENVVGFSFGVIDEYVRATWAEAIDESYALFVDMSGGKSHRHLDYQSPSSQ